LTKLENYWIVQEVESLSVLCYVCGKLNFDDYVRFPIKIGKLKTSAR